jgi:hypothetical protein
MMVMVKQQCKNARRMHSGMRERSCSGLRARRVQGTSSTVMMRSKHLISIMFSFTRGQSCDGSSSSPDAAVRKWNQNLQSELSCLLARYPSALCACSVDSGISERRHPQRNWKPFSLRISD